MGGFVLVAYWRFGDAADEWIGVIDCKKVIEAPLCLSLVDTD